MLQLRIILKGASSNSEVPSRLWNSNGGTLYGAGGGRNVLILAPDLSLSHPEAVPRRPGQLTQGDKLKLQSQGLPPDSCHNELDIIKARYELNKGCKIVEVKSGQSLSQKEVIENIAHLLNTTQNDGGKEIRLCTSCTLKVSNIAYGYMY